MFTGACAAPGIDVTPAPSTTQDRPNTYDDRPWATALRENVKDDLVDYAHLSAHRDPLEAFLRVISEVGPTCTPDSFPTPNDRTCYYINAYNAGMLAAVLHAQVPESMHDYRIGSVERATRLRVDGRTRTLGDLRRLARESAGDDVRVVFALCDAAMSSPPLHDQPFRPENLEESLRLLAQRAMDNPKMVAVDHARQRLLLSIDLTSRRTEFIAYYRRRTGAAEATMLNVVMDFANPVRRQWLNTAVGYAEATIPFDRRLNRWTPP